MKPIKLLLSLEAVKALYLAADHVLYGDWDGEPLDDNFLDQLGDVRELLQQTVKDADEEALIEAVKPEPEKKLAFISRHGTSPLEDE